MHYHCDRYLVKTSHTTTRIITSITGYFSFISKMVACNDQQRLLGIHTGTSCYKAASSPSVCTHALRQGTFFYVYNPLP